MMTQLEAAQRGTITSAIKSVSQAENVPIEIVIKELALGYSVIPANPSHTGLKPLAVGRPFRTKVNANIGRSEGCSSTSGEKEKVNVAESAGADFIMDLSVGLDLDVTRKSLLEVCSLPFGTVPIYEAFSRVSGSIASLDTGMLLSVIEDQAEQGVDFMTIHAGLLREHVDLALKRKLGIVSRGGAVLAEWMVDHDSENPFYTCWDEIMDICREHDVTVSLGDGLRPGCLADASDDAQFAELDVLGSLVKRCRAKGVQVMVEGPGHVPFNEIQMNMERQQDVCDKAPFYVLGPVVTDIAPGYDHITSSIGATAAAFYGASLLCYVTPAEHLGLPTRDEVKKGVIAYRIAAHAADVARKLPGARAQDDAMADARKEFDWESQFALAMDEDGARTRYNQGRSASSEKDDFCSMCGKDFCAVRTSKRISSKRDSQLASCGSENVSS